MNRESHDFLWNSQIPELLPAVRYDREKKIREGTGNIVSHYGTRARLPSDILSSQPDFDCNNFALGGIVRRKGGAPGS